MKPIILRGPTGLPPIMGGSDWPALGEGGQTEAGIDAANSTAPLITASASAHTKGAYTQLIASTAFDADGFWAIIGRGASIASYFLDFAIGAAAAEQVILPNLMVYNPSNDQGNRYAYFPLSIPAGTRISARCQASIAGSAAIRAGCLLDTHGFIPSNPMARVTDYGLATGTTTGTTIDPGGTIHTKGAWAQIVASLTNDIEYLILALGYRLQLVAPPGPSWLIDIGVGGAGSEQVVVSNIWAGVAGAWDDFLQQFIGPLPVHIPAGSRMAIRAQCATATSPDRTFAAGVYGID